MSRNLIYVILAGLFLSGCRMQVANRLLGAAGSTASPVPPTPSAEALPTELPTMTALAPSTITPSPVPDLALAGLPTETAGEVAVDFAADICSAEWSNGNGQLPCKGNESSTNSGYVMLLNGNVQGLPSYLSLLLMYPPQSSGDTISGKYPEFTVQKGDRFRAVLGCRAHTFCDVEFGLEYYDSTGRSGLAHWSYLFTDAPIVADYSLNGIAGRTVQFSLVVHRHGYGLQAFAVWVMPHIYRPIP